MLSGTRAKCQVLLYKDNIATYKEMGEVIFKDEGIGGIVIMNISNPDTPTPNYIYANKIGDLVFDYTEISEEEYNKGPSDLKEYYIYAGKTEDDENYYTKCENLTQFENGIKYYTAKVRVKHHSGDLIWYKYSYDNVSGAETWEISDLTDSEVNGSPNYKHKVSEISYIGICKDVPWVNGW